MIPRTGGGVPCPRHRSALLDVELGESAERSGPAWQHLDWCTECRRDMESAAQTIVALRRIGKEVALTQPSGEAWPRLRDRVTNRQPAEHWRARLSLGGLVVAAALVATFAVPATFVSRQPGRFEESSPPAFLSRPADLIDTRAEERWLRVRPASAATASDDESSGSFIFDQRRFGESIPRPPWSPPQAKLQ